MDDVPDGLEEGAVWSAPDESVRRVATHAAYVFLVGDKAYKIKRPVSYSFLDFTTLEARRAALEHELELNRRTAPALYLRVLPVARAADGRLRAGGEGEVVEWALEMARFPDDAQLDRVAERGALDPALAEALGAEIAGFHETLDPLADTGGAAAMAAVVEGNAEDLRRLVPDVFDESAVQALDDRTRAEHARLAGLLDTRRDAGRVRFCHGDLHLQNLVLLEGRPVPFDCIEFNDDFAKIDVWYDVAFLLMDLLRRGLAPQAQRCLQGYVEAGGDLDGLALLPFFLAVRSTVRAKVEGFAAEGAGGGRGAESKRRAARGFLERVAAFLAPPPPVLVAVGGLSGTGKTTVARGIAPTIGPAPGAVVLRSDVVRKQLLGARVTDRLPPEAYAPEASERVYDELCDRSRQVLRAGHAAVVDAASLRGRERARLESVADEAGVPFAGLWLEAPIDLLRERIGQRSGDASDATAEVVARQAEIDPGTIGWTRIAAGQKTEAVLAAALRELAAVRPA